MLFLRSAAQRDVVKIRKRAFTTMSSNDVIDDTLKTRNSVSGQTESSQTGTIGH